MPERAKQREGEKVWVPDPRNVWQLGTVVEDNGDKLFVQLPEVDKEEAFNVDQVHPFDPSHALDLDNISEMDNLHQAPLLDLLRRRYLDDHIYTYTGDILISINPYKTIPLLYNFPELDSIGKIDNPVPHVYSTAHGAYHAMRKDGKNQSVLVSGESGAGKTEASKYIMRYLANISEIGKKSPKPAESTSEEVSGRSSVEQCVLQSNPLLEAFGNAKTIRNDNSSRFGKFIKIFYHRDGTISGATTSHFLLEKSRIVGSAESERNYHVFYQLCAGMPAEEKAKLKLKTAGDYYYLNQGNCLQVPEINDKKDFKELVEAMGTVGISSELQHIIFTLVAVVLHLGNLEFTENSKLEAVIERSQDITDLAELMQVTPDELQFALTKRTMSAGARGSVAEISLSADEAIKSRNGLAKDLFSKMFDWLVSQINLSTREGLSSSAPGGGGAQFIGILDIFGFESLQFNSFEQLCINYTNEMLQQQFNQHVFVYEQEVYVEEGIDFSRLEFKDNGPCLDLIDKKPLGILPLLDEQGMLGRRASDENFLQKLNQTHLPKGKVDDSVTQYYSKPRFSTDQFTINHYAGEVTYNVAGFLEKNDDSLHGDLISLMDSSKCEFLRSLFPAAPKESGGVNPRKPIKRAGNKMTGTMTVGRKFRDQMAGLMTELKATAPSFVRCVKPNNLRFPSGWNAELILNQLIYLGVMETVRIRRSGFPVRRLFDEFYKKYDILTRKKVPRSKREKMSDKELCVVILEHINRENWQLGHKKVFLRDSQLRTLDNEARKITQAAAIEIQKNARRMIQRKWYLNARKKVILLQSVVRMYHHKLRFQKAKAGVTRFNALSKQFVQRRKFLRIRRAAVITQAHFRGKKARAHVWYLRNAPKAATKINACVRMFMARRKYLKKKHAASVICNAQRMRSTRREFIKKRKAASIIASRYKGKYQRNKYERMKKAAIVIHAAGRGFCARMKYGKKARIRIAIQSKAQVQISRRVRGYLARLFFLRSRRRIIMIQARIRANRVRTEYLKGREATIHSQAMIRRALVRRKFLRERKMATRIEAFSRMVVYRARYHREKKKIVILQALWRMHQHRAQYNKTMHGISLLQSRWRGHVARKQYDATLGHIRVLQGFGRMIIARKQFLCMKKAAVMFQATTRGFLVRKKDVKRKRGVVKIQAIVRRFLAQKRYARALNHIILVQSIFRGKKAKRASEFRRRAVARMTGVIRFHLSRIRMRNRTKELFEAANAYDLTAVLHISQQAHGMLRVRDRWNSQMSLVHVAAKNSDLNLARFVLEENSDLEDLVYGRDIDGSTPLHYACRLADLEMAKLLAKVANLNTAPTLWMDFEQTGAGRDRSASNSSLSPSNQAMDSFREEKNAPKSPSRRTFSSAESTVSSSTISGTPLNEMMRRDRNISTVSSNASFAMQMSMKPGEKPTNGLTTPKKNHRRSLVSSGPPIANNRRVSVNMPNVLPPTIELKVHKEGFLKKATGGRWANKRYVVVDEVCLSYYKAPKEIVPLGIVELCDVTIKRVSHVDNCFEIHSPRLKCVKNPEGAMSFVAESEEEVHDWMVAVRKVQGVRIATSSPPYHGMICIDSNLRREYVNMTNKAGFTPLHLSVQNDEDEGLEAAKVGVWLIENGANVNAQDAEGDTPLHYAVMLERHDLVEVLMKRGADPSITNNKGLSPTEIAVDADMKQLLDPSMHAEKDPNRLTLLPSPPHLADSTYVSVFIGAVAIATHPVMNMPHFNFYIMDFKGQVVSKYQHSPNSLMQVAGNQWWFGNTWYLQPPLEHLKDGCVAVMELRHRSLVTEETEVGCWTFFRLDLGKITSSPVTFEMYAPPVDPSSSILARIPGDSFLQADINVLI